MNTTELKAPVKRPIRRGWFRRLQWPRSPAISALYPSPGVAGQPGRSVCREAGALLRRPIFQLALLGVAAVFLYRAALLLQPDDADGPAAKSSASPPVSEQDQQVRQQAFEVTSAVVVEGIRRLDAASRRLDSRIADLEVAQGVTRLLSPEPGLEIGVSRLDPGPSPAEMSRRTNRTVSGVSVRALDAYTRETGFDPAEVESLMRRN